jgi:3-polyprenyl-4-hydroxybenzoate decarboxylase
MVEKTDARMTPLHYHHAKAIQGLIQVLLIVVLNQITFYDKKRTLTTIVEFIHNLVLSLWLKS